MTFGGKGTSWSRHGSSQGQEESHPTTDGRSPTQKGGTLVVFQFTIKVDVSFLGDQQRRSDLAVNKEQTLKGGQSIRHQYLKQYLDSFSKEIIQETNQHGRDMSEGKKHVKAEEEEVDQRHKEQTNVKLDDHHHMVGRLSFEGRLKDMGEKNKRHF
ncbi:hypothetical protein GYH30_004623 [Glycine max]|nr:hypothetical protein GYH30_004623 [Glycine max]